MRITISFASIMITLALALAAPAAGAATPPPNAGKMRASFAQVANFRLTDSFLRNDLAYSLDVARHPCQSSIKAGLMMFRDLQSMPLDQVIARFDANSNVHAMLAKHGLSAHDAVVGGLVMFMVGMEHMSNTPEGKRLGGTVSGKGLDTPAMKTNLAFYKAHWPEIRAIQQKISAIVKRQMDANGHKAACLRKNAQQLMSSGLH
jgi:hypothetical protein